ncbi:MAG: caspase family protein [Thiobacillus sp.]
MKYTQLILACVTTLALMVAHAAEIPPPKFALVIGNADYPGKARLANPVPDAELIADTFRRLGYQTTLLKNADRAAMIRAVAQLADAMHRGGVAALYFSGHGLQLGGEDFLLPVGLPPLTQNLLRNDAYPLQLALDRLHNSGAQVSLIIVDACRNVPYGWGYRTLNERGLAKLKPAEGMLIAFATAPGELALDGKTGSHHSPFTAALANAMEMPNLSIDQVFAQVRTQVREQTHNEQQPWVDTSLVGDFYFRPPANMTLKLAGLAPAHGGWTGLTRQLQTGDKKPANPPISSANKSNAAISSIIPFPILAAKINVNKWGEKIPPKHPVPVYPEWPNPLQQSPLIDQYHDIKYTAKNLTLDDLPRLIHKAQRGDMVAQITLGFAYRDTLPQQWRSNPKAVKWFRKAARHGSPIAQTELGEMYHQGIGVDTNIHKAMQLFEAASKSGYLNAKLDLAWYARVDHPGF